ncbi:MAG: hypothetical protein H6962_03955 [Chromatiaceae bacterium]|nr:hypothetical protein [Chromatiaceae bacterium]
MRKARASAAVSGQLSFCAPPRAQFLLDLLRQQLHLQPVRGRQRHVADDTDHQLLQVCQGLVRLALDARQQLDDGFTRTEFAGRLGILQRL